MKINWTTAPHIRHHENTRLLMADTILAMLIIYAMAFYYYGPRVVAVGLLSVGFALFTDIAGTLISGRRPHIRDLSAVVTGMLIPLLMPASIPFRIVAVAAIFAVAVAKQPFGGVGHNVFNPAAAGLSFVTICFTSEMFTYTQPSQWLPMYMTSEQTTVSSPAFTMLVGGIPPYRAVDMALGGYPGPMGATNILVVAACLLYLVFRGTIRWQLPLFFFLTVSGYCLLFPRAGMTSLQTLQYETMSGILLLGGVFLLGDPVTTPKRAWSRGAFAVTAGIIVMLFRRYGLLEDSMVFAVLVMNAAVWGFDMMGERLAAIFRRKRFEAVHNPKVSKKA